MRSEDSGSEDWLKWGWERGVECGGEGGEV